MSDNTGGPAFPVSAEFFSGGSMRRPPFDGMTLRDYFAAKICASMLVAVHGDTDFPNLDYQRVEGGPSAGERAAQIAYKMADLMLKARE